jgi:hypothetical protein
MKRFSFGTALIAIMLGLPACGSDDKPFTQTKTSSLENPENVRAWANAASAYAVYGNVYQLFAVADGDQRFPDPACPVVEDDGTTLTATGGCEATDGSSWVGSAEVVRSADGDRALTLSDFGSLDDVTEGDAHLRVVADAITDFDLNLTRTGGIVTTIEYDGRVEGSYGTSTIWNGSGTLTRDGLVTPNGTVDVTTTDEVVDNDVCAGQPVSGNTTIQNEADESVVVTYDGAVDCDDEEAANWSLDGEPQGKITGIACSLGRGSGGGPGSAWLAFGVALAVAGASVRRRSRWRIETKLRSI